MNAFYSFNPHRPEIKRNTMHFCFFPVWVHILNPKWIKYCSTNKFTDPVPLRAVSGIMGLCLYLRTVSRVYLTSYVSSHVRFSMFLLAGYPIVCVAHVRRKLFLLHSTTQIKSLAVPSLRLPPYHIPCVQYIANNFSKGNKIITKYSLKNKLELFFFIPIWLRLFICGV